MSHSPRRPITLLTSAPIVDVLPLSPPSSSSSSSTNFLSSSSSHQLKLQLTPPTPTTPISSWPKSPSSSSAFTRRSYSPSPSPSHDDQLRGTLPLPSLVRTSLQSLLSSTLLSLLSSTNDDDEDDYEEDEDGGILPSHSPKRELSRAHRSRGFRRTTRRSRGMGRSVKLVTMLVFWMCFVFWVTALMGVETIFE